MKDYDIEECYKSARPWASRQLVTYEPIEFEK